ncbi:MAG: response regulator transcription factor [Acidobacteriota bacterium]
MAVVLVVDDDAELAGLLREYLGEEGFEVVVEGNGEDGARAALENAPDLVVLDVMLPRLGGFDVLRRIRERSSVPVIMLTARGQEVDRIVGLELGADDYLAKPFNPRELAARIRAVLRRGRGEVAAPGPMVVGDLRLESGSRRAFCGGAAVELTGTEYSLLELLVREAGRVVRREALFREVLGRRGASYDRSLDVHVSNLRRKLGPLPGGVERIKNVRRLGYQYVIPGG